MSRDFRKLQVWQKSHELVLDIYRETHCFPREEVYGLTSQMRRAAVSIPSNLAEGCGRGGESELRRFIEIAQGSDGELAYQIILAAELGYLNQSAMRALADRAEEANRMLTALRTRLMR